MRIVAFTFGLALLLSLSPHVASAQIQTDSTYAVQDGDTLYSIAQKVGVSVRSLMQWNGMDDTTLEVGRTLRIRPPTSRSQEPSTDAPDTTAQPSLPPSPSADTTTSDGPPYGRYSAQEGDSFVGLALRLGTTADSLFALNDSTTSPLSASQSVRLPRRFGPPTHRVESGQTLYSIAGQYGVSARTLKMKNNLDTDTLQPGQRLQIPRREIKLPPSGEWAAPDSTGRVAIYPDAYAGRLTASGTAYDPNEFVASHPWLPFDSVVLLSAQNPPRHTFARVIDRGPVEEGVLLDVSNAVAQQLDLDGEEASSIALRVVWVPTGSD